MKKYLCSFVFVLTTISSHALLNTNLLRDALEVGTPGEVLQSTFSITTGILGDLPDFLPSPKFFLQKTKDIVAGYPFKVLLTLIHAICSAAVSSESVQPRKTPDIKDLRFILLTPQANFTFPLLDAKKLWTSPAFDPNKKVVIYITGWQTDLEQNRFEINRMAEPFFCRNDSNFVVVNTARYIDTLYTWAAFNTVALGESVGKALAEAIPIVPIANIHLIGHSLGAHICGEAGRTFTAITGNVLARITGLDPANPCFNEGGVLSGLQRGDAAFIDVIHSNSGVLGKREPVGDVDFYPGGVTTLPPGCVDIICAHLRSIEYFAESAMPGHEQNFRAKRCTSLYKYNAGECIGEEILMGLKTPTTAVGNYFLDVNAKEPFGQNAQESEVTCQ